MIYKNTFIFIVLLLFMCAYAGTIPCMQASDCPWVDHCTTANYVETCDHDNACVCGGGLIVSIIQDSACTLAPLTCQCTPCLLQGTCQYDN